MFFNHSYIKHFYGKFYYLGYSMFCNHHSYHTLRSTFIHKYSATKIRSWTRICPFRRSFHSCLLLCPKRTLKIIKKSDRGIIKLFTRQLNTNGKDGKKTPDRMSLKIIMSILAWTVFSALFLGMKGKYAIPITWETFIEDILTSGEVSEIRHIYNSDTVIICMKPGAVINNVQHPPGVIYYMKVKDFSTFEEDLRIAEENLGIPPADRIQIINEYSEYLHTLLNILIILVLVSLIYNFAMKMPGLNPFAKISKAKFTLIDPLSGHTKGVMFSDVGGLKEAKVEIMEFVDYLKRPDHYKSLGAKVPRGALLLGPPGCGKTLLAKAVASEANVPFLSMNGSEFIELIGGLGAARVRDLFTEARNISPCIIYIDEIDAIGKKRASSGIMTGSHMEEEHTLNQLLVEMDGMASREGVVTLASTNRAEVLDGALLRPGRFDRHIMIDLPNVEERREIFIQHMKGIHLEYKPEHYAKRMASLTPGFSGADIANVCNEAALHAARLKRNIVKGDDLEYAIERVVGGTEKRSSAISPEEKRLVAYHEAGRALIGWLSKHGEILVKVSVVPRTHQTVGWSQFSPPDQHLYSEEELFDKMCMALGGRVAESLIFNKISTKSEKDLAKVTRIAYAQIRQYGMNNIVGPVSFDTEDYLVKPYSKQLGSLIDEEARKLVAKAFFEAEKILRENRDILVKFAETLLKRETMNYSDVVETIGPPRHADKKAVEPLVFEMTVDMAAGPEPAKERD